MMQEFEIQARLKGQTEIKTVRTGGHSLEEAKKHLETQGYEVVAEKTKKGE